MRRFRIRKGVGDHRTRTLLISLLAVIALVTVAMVLPVPYVKLAPGPTFDVVGEEDGEPFIVIDGAATFPASGSLHMTTVRESGGPRGGLTFVEAIAGWFSDPEAVIPQELIYPEPVTGDEVRERQALLFSTSESDAIAAALTYLDLPISSEVVATAVILEAPAGEVLKPRDVIVAVDDVPVTVPTDVVEAVKGQPIGTTFILDIEREGEPQQVSITSEERPDDPGSPYLGVTVGAFFTPEFDINFTLDDVGGPSAGLVFAMGLVELLNEEDLTAGGTIAGTGTIAPDGSVGPIGGIRQKLAGAYRDGATLFLMPERHCAEARGHIPSGLTVVPVANLAEAIEAVRAWVAGKTVTNCPPVA